MKIRKAACWARLQPSTSSKLERPPNKPPALPARPSQERMKLAMSDLIQALWETQGLWRSPSILILSYQGLVG